MTKITDRAQIGPDTPEQDIIDFVFAALVKQDRISFSGESSICMYRAPCGAQCGVGHLITDEEYTEEMEGLNVHVLVRTSKLPARLETHAYLLKTIQEAHDDLRFNFRHEPFGEAIYASFDRQLTGRSHPHLKVPSLEAEG